MMISFVPGYEPCRIIRQNGETIVCCHYDTIIGNIFDAVGKGDFMMNDYTPKTKAMWLAWMQPIPDYEARQEIGRIARHYSNNFFLACINSYTLGFIDGKRHERRRRKHD